MLVPAVVALAALLTGLALWYGSEEPPLLAPEAPSAPGPAEPGVGRLDRRHAPAEDAGARHPARAAAAPIADTEEQPDRDARDTLHVVVFDVRGIPVGGALVEVREREGAGVAILDDAFERRDVLVANGRTSALGEAAFELPVGRPHDVVVQAASWPPEHRRSCFAGERIEFRLQPGARLSGHLTRLEDEAPVSGARVQLVSTDELRGERRVATSDAAGAWSIGDLKPGTYELDVDPPREVVPRRIEVVLEPGDRQVRDIALRSGVSVAGRVTDAATGVPIVGALVGAHGRTVASDARGDYVFPGFGWVELECRAAGYAGAERRLRRSLEEPVPERVDFALRRGWTATGRVVDGRGAPVADAYVGAVATDFAGELDDQRLDWISDRTGDQGTFRLVSLRSDMLHTLVVRRRGFGTVLVDLAPAADGETRALPELVLQRARRVAGRVVDERGSPLARHPVVLRGDADGRAAGLDEPRPANALLDGYVAETRRWTDLRGRFDFLDVAPGEYVVETSLGERHPRAEREVLVGARDVLGVELEVFAGLSIRGRVTVDDGGRVPKTYVSVQPEDGGTSAHAECDAEGRFEARGLEAGSYRLIFYPYPTEEERAAGRRIPSVRREGVQAGEKLEVVLEVRR